MSFDELAIGQRIAYHRARRRLTQAELAGLIGISTSMMKKIESGGRLVTRFSQLVRFAEALGVRDLRELTGVPLPMMPGGRRGHPAAAAVWEAFLARSRPAGKAPTLDGLADHLERTWQTWQEPSAFRCNAVGQQLPTLIGQVQSATHHGEGTQRRQAFRLASKLYQLVRTWTKRVGEYELSLMAADRAVSAALEADDPDLTAAAAWNLSMILSAQGKTEHARAVVYRAIEELQPHMGRAGQPRMAVFGGLHLLGAAEAARDDSATEANRLLDTAHHLAERTGETNHFRIVFGPINVALHRVSIAAELGRTSDALAMAEQVAIDGSPAVERRLTFRLDTARCYARERNDIAAMHMLHRAHQESPEELHHNSLARETLRQITGRATPSMRPDLRPLLEAAGLPD